MPGKGVAVVEPCPLMGWPLETFLLFLSLQILKYLPSTTQYL
jgi:hypothetical protein